MRKSRQESERNDEEDEDRDEMQMVKNRWESGIRGKQ